MATALTDFGAWNCLFLALWHALQYFYLCSQVGRGTTPLRSAEQPLGLDGLRWEDEMLVFLGNLFLERTVEACLLVFAFGGDFMIENPLLSLLWATPQLLEPVRRTRAFQLDCDQCAFGTPWKKPTRFVCSSELLETLAVTCPGGHTHQKLKGKVWDPQRQQMVF